MKMLQQLSGNGDFNLRYSEIMCFHASEFGKFLKEMTEKGKRFPAPIRYCAFLPFLSMEIGIFLENRRNSINNVLALQKLDKTNHILLTQLD